jgi:hexosaminidase
MSAFKKPFDFAARISLSCIVSLAFGVGSASAATAPAGIAPTAIVPQPQSLTLAAAQPPFQLSTTVPVLAPTAFTGPAGLLANTIGLRLVDTDKANNVDSKAKAIRFVLEPIASGVAGAYRLQVRDGAITIYAAEPTGALNAAETLLQMLPPGDAARLTADKPPVAIAALDIADAPRFAWRGLTLDVSRHFFGVTTIKHVIDSMAAYKLNRLHLHLTDDTGWRFPIRAYPKLITVGAIGDGSDQNGPAQFYTEDDIRSIVSYAAERQIEVVPELEMPGHAGAAARAYPEFFDGGHTYNPANPGTYRFIDAVLDEVTKLFPGRYIHFGGDEVNANDTGWSKMPDVIAMARKLDPSSEKPNFKAVEREFARHVVQLIRKHNRTPVGWDEIIAAGLNADTFVQWWRPDSPQTMKAALDQGQSVIMSPADRMYLDYAAGLGEPGAPWEGNNGGPVSVEKIVGWDPVPAEYTAEEKSHIAGVEAALWTEFVRSEPYFEYMLYPRLAAVAEVAWRQQANSTPAAFAERLAPHIERWKALGRTVNGGYDDALKFRVH